MECLSLSVLFSFCSFTQIKREGNMVAHGLAKLACQGQEMIWVEDYPPAIGSLVDSDCIHMFDQ